MEYLLGKAQHTSLAPAEQDELRRYVQVAQPGAKDVTFETIVTLGLIQSSVRTCCIRISNLRREASAGSGDGPGVLPAASPGFMLVPLHRRSSCTSSRFAGSPRIPDRPGRLRAAWIPVPVSCRRQGLLPAVCGRGCYPRRGCRCRGDPGREWSPVSIFPAYEARIPYQPQRIRSILNRGRISRVNRSWLTGGVRDAAGAGDPGPNPRSVGRRELHRTAALQRILFGMFLSGGRSHYARF